MKRKIEDDPLYAELKDVYKKKLYWECPFDKVIMADCIELALIQYFGDANRHADNREPVTIYFYFPDNIDADIDVKVDWDDIDDIDNDTYFVSHWRDFIKWCEDRFNENEGMQKSSMVKQTLMDTALEFSRRHKSWSLRTIPAQKELTRTGLDVSDPLQWIFKLYFN